MFCKQRSKPQYVQVAASSWIVVRTNTLFHISGQTSRGCWGPASWSAALINRGIKEDAFASSTVYVLFGSMSSTKSEKLLGDTTDESEKPAGHDILFHLWSCKWKGGRGVEYLMWQVGYIHLTDKFVQVETELFALTWLLCLRLPICSFGGYMWTCCSGLEFTSAGPCWLWAACAEIRTDITGCVLDWWPVAPAVSHSGFEGHPGIPRKGVSF